MFDLVKLFDNVDGACVWCGRNPCQCNDSRRTPKPKPKKQN